MKGAVEGAAVPGEDVAEAGSDLGGDINCVVPRGGCDGKGEFLGGHGHRVGARRADFTATPPPQPAEVPPLGRRASRASRVLRPRSGGHVRLQPPSGRAEHRGELSVGDRAGQADHQRGLEVDAVVEPGATTTQILEPVVLDARAAEGQGGAFEAEGEAPSPFPGEKMFVHRHGGQRDRASGADTLRLGAGPDHTPDPLKPARPALAVGEDVEHRVGRRLKLHHVLETIGRPFDELESDRPALEPHPQRLTRSSPPGVDGAAVGGSAPQLGPSDVLRVATKAEQKAAVPDRDIGG